MKICNQRVGGSNPSASSMENFKIVDYRRAQLDSLYTRAAHGAMLN
jgi:hypothetical protein